VIVLRPERKSSRTLHNEQ